MSHTGSDAEWHVGKDKDEISSCGLNVVSLPLLLTSMESNLISQAQYLECLSLLKRKTPVLQKKDRHPTLLECFYYLFFYFLTGSVCIRASHLRVPWFWFKRC